MLSIALCDDNTAELNTTFTLLQSALNTLNIKHNITKYNTASKLMSDTGAGILYELYILDIIMPLISGIQLADTITHIYPEANIVFTTTSPDFALDGFRIRAVDYILKPINIKRLNDTILKVYNSSFKQSCANLIIKTEIGSCSIYYPQVTYIEYHKHRFIFHLSDNTSVTSLNTRQSFKDFGNNLNCSYFGKPHISYIVNMHYISTIQKNSIILKDGTHIPISRSMYSQFKLTYMNWLLSNKEEF